MKSVFAFCALALVEVFVAQARADLVSLDSTTLELVERAATDKTARFAIPARVSANDVKIRHWKITRDGTRVDRAGSNVTLGTVDDDGYADLTTELNLTKLAMPGPYVVAIEFAAPKPARQPAAQGITEPPILGTPAAGITGSQDSQTVQLTLTKPAAELQTDTPVYVYSTSIIPFVWSVSEPAAVTLREVARKSWAAINPTDWNITLRQGETLVRPNALSAKLPDLVDGGGQATATLTLNGPVPLGTNTGTLTIQAPQIAAQLLEVPVTVVSRLAGFWLLLMIAAGIVVGWLVRVRIERRRARLAATIPADEEIAALDRLINETDDPTFRRRFQDERETLIKAMPRTATPEAIIASTSAAASARRAIESELEARADELRVALQAWRQAANFADALPDEGQPAFGAFSNRIAELEANLESGRLTAVERGLADPNLMGRLVRALREWLRQFEDLKSDPPEAWAEVIRGRLNSLTAEAAGLDLLLQAVATPDALLQALIDTATLLTHARNDVEAVRDRAQAMAKSTSELLLNPRIDLGVEAEAIGAKADALPSSASAGEPGAVAKFFAAVDGLSAAIADGLEAAWTGKLGQASPLAGLAEGKFSDGLRNIEKALAANAEHALGGESPSATPSVITEWLAMDLRTARSAESHPIFKVLLKAGPATVGDPVTVEANLIVPTAGAAPNVTLHWAINGVPLAVAPSGDLEQKFTFNKPGLVAIRVVVEAADGTRVAENILIEVRSVRGAAAIAENSRSLAWAEAIQTMVAGAILLAAGWQIFSPNFVGTGSELFAAFLWGFTLDIGVAKVLEIAGPVRQLQLPARA